MRFVLFERGFSGFVPLTFCCHSLLFLTSFSDVDDIGCKQPIKGTKLPHLVHDPHNNLFFLMGCMVML